MPNTNIGANFDLTLIGCSQLGSSVESKNPIIPAALINPSPGAINPGPTCNPVPPPLPGSTIGAYWQPSDDSQHVNFIDANGDVHELFQSQINPG